MAVRQRVGRGGDRDRWSADPMVRVGSLRFGMNAREVGQFLGGVVEFSLLDGKSGRVVSSDYRIESSGFMVPSGFLSVYFNGKEELSAIAVDARNGPQVLLNGLSLVGRVPSELENEILKYVEFHNLEINYSEYGTPSVESLGVILAAQRVDDVVLSRPVFVCEEWSERCGDSTEGPVPQAEWHRHSC